MPFPFHCVNHARKHYHVCLVIYHVEHIAHKASGNLAVDKWCAFVHCVAKFAVFVNSLVFARLKSECADGYNVGLLGDYREREAWVAFQYLGGVVVLVFVVAVVFIVSSLCFPLAFLVSLSQMIRCKSCEVGMGGLNDVVGNNVGTCFS